MSKFLIDKVCVKSDINNKIKKGFILIRTMATSKTRNDITEHPTILKNLFTEAVQSVQPSSLIKNQVKLVDRHLVVAEQQFVLAKPCYMVGFGKAVLGMALELENTLRDCLERSVVTIPKGIFENYPQFLGISKKIQFIEGGADNIPDEQVVEGAVKIKELVEKLDKDDLLIVLISGGGSALLPFPKPPITLEEKQTIIKGLSRGGASIQELNIVRKQLSVLKGGGLANLAYPCKVISLILSDVVGDPLDLIASGPTVYSEEESDRAIEILKKYTIYENIPASIKTVLENPENELNRTKSVTPSENREKKLFPNEKSQGVSNFIIGTNRIATQATKNRATKNGFQCVVVSNKVEGNVDVVAEIYAKLARLIVDGNEDEIRALLENMPFELEHNAVGEIMSLCRNKKIILIFAGEPTVFVKGTGRGGRNQQLALAFSLHLNKFGIKSRNISFLSGGTDGIDGPTDAAGAIGFSRLAEACSKLDINPEQYLKNNDSYRFFSRLDDGKFLVKIGHTGTNVMDLHLLLIE